MEIPRLLERGASLAGVESLKRGREDRAQQRAGGTSQGDEQQQGRRRAPSAQTPGNSGTGDFCSWANACNRDRLVVSGWLAVSVASPFPPKVHASAQHTPQSGTLPDTPQPSQCCHPAMKPPAITAKSGTRGTCLPKSKCTRSYRRAGNSGFSC